MNRQLLCKTIITNLHSKTGDCIIERDMISVSRDTMSVEGDDGIDIKAGHVPQDDITDQLLSPPDCRIVLELGVPHDDDVGHGDTQDTARLIQFLFPGVAPLSSRTHHQQEYFTPSLGQTQDGWTKEHHFVIRMARHK